jgi:pilus assembly protein CpaD
MFDANSKTRTATARKTATAAPYHRPVVSIAAAVAVALLAGCTMPQRDSITVGAIPDDYRTNHPIVIAEKEQSIDLPVGRSDRGMTKTQRVALGGFLSTYDRSASPVLNILVPAGAENEVAAADASRDMVGFAKASGVPRSRIIVSSYETASVYGSPPIRVSYVSMKAQTGKCGRWPDDIAETSENKHYADFGCSSQNNLAAQVADPADLLGPRKQTTIDAEKRSIVIDQYRRPPILQGTEIEY